jgi:pilus assembly protein Flp/PilA
MLKNINAVLSDESGQGLVEYGLILTFVSIVAIAALTGLGTAIKTTLTTVTTSL